MEIAFNKDTNVQCKKPTFLSNNKNKQKFVDMLADALREVYVEVITCHADADVAIVLKAIEKVADSNTVLVGDDTDLIAIGIHYYKDAATENGLYMYRKSSDTCIDFKKLLSGMPKPIKDTILAIHAASGCDTVSALFGIGKLKLFKICEKSPDAHIIDLNQFYQENIDIDVLVEAGTRLTVKLYDKDQKHDTMEALRLWQVINYRLIIII